MNLSLSLRTLALGVLCIAPAAHAQEAQAQEAQAQPALDVQLVAGRDRLIYPGKKLEKVRLGVRLTFGANAPAFLPGMLTTQALKWVDSAGAEHPIDATPPSGEASALPEGTVMRTVLALDAPAFANDGKNFELRWSWTGAPAKSLDFRTARAVAAEALPNFEALDVSAVNRSFVKLHFAKIGADGAKTALGSLLYAIEIGEEDLDLARFFLKNAIGSNQMDGVPVYHLDPQGWMQAGKPIDGSGQVPIGFAGRLIVPSKTETTYERGDLIAVATLLGGGARPTPNMWYGQLLVPFVAQRVPPYSEGPMSRRLGRVVGGIDLLDQLSALRTVRDQAPPILRPVDLIVIDDVEYLSFDS